ncbi:MAG: type I phosphomannose isomerase catalytic subunit [Planctomycetota bacterium]|jgi:mannose-6-phosphate isomerase
MVRVDALAYADRMVRPDYPLRLTPHLAARVWGGQRLGPGIGEAWDLSVHPHGPCRIANGALRGRTLAEVSGAHPDAFGGPIALLAKRLDCARTLSVQVHPPAGDPKTEAWVVLDATEGAGVYHGFRRPVTREEVRGAGEDGSLPELLRFVRTKPGAAVFVPSGVVHAIGGGLFLFEIQQSADTTYRLYDWGRGRELHLEEGLACAELGTREALPAPRNGRLVECEYFRVDRLAAAAPVDPGPTWTALLVLEGSGRLGDVAAEAQQTVLLPAAAGPQRWTPEGASAVLVYGPP